MDIFSPTAWKQEITALRYIKRGHATLRELIELNYGEWPLRELDIATDKHLEHSVTITPMGKWWWRVVTTPEPSKAQWAKKALLTTIIALRSSGITPHGNSREIVLNGVHRLLFYCCGRMISNRIIAHERRHVHQFETVAPSRRAEIFGSSFGAMDKARANAIIDAMMSDGMKSASSARQLYESTLYRLSRWMYKNTGQHLNRLYYRSGVEIQSRMEELLVKGYRYWQRMPSNRAELYAVFWNAGIKPPPRMRDALKNHPAFQSALKEFKAPLYANVKAPYGLIAAVSQLPTQNIAMSFWEVALPSLYGDLLDTLGDRMGSARMSDENVGLSPHTLNSERLFRANTYLVPLCLGTLLDRCVKGECSSSLDQEVTQMATKIPPGYLAGFLASLYDAEQNRAKMSGRYEIPQGHERFLLSCLNAPRVMDILDAHKPPLFYWARQRSSLDRSPRRHDAHQPPCACG